MTLHIDKTKKIQNNYCLSCDHSFDYPEWQSPIEDVCWGCWDRPVISMKEARKLAKQIMNPHNQ